MRAIAILVVVAVFGFLGIDMVFRAVGLLPPLAC